MSAERYFKRGHDTSEFRMTQLAHLLGVAVLAAGLLMTTFGALYVLWPVIGGGVGLAYVGGEILHRTVVAYSHSRGAVKSSAIAPPVTTITRLGAPRL